ncbi:MAG TPA: hypothetical protein VE110_00405 [Gemmatimonadaceae bacterium]|nr:hypothetical protein [Gemmatimonadaceae bacterium]
MGFRAVRWTICLAGFALAVDAADAQQVLLQIRPHIGDTLRMHLSQSVEMRGTQSNNRRDTTSMMTSIEVFTRAIAQRWTPSGTLMQTITDSVAMSPASAGSLADLRRRAMQAKPVWIRVSTDGAMEMVDDGDPNSELRNLFGEMPAVLNRAAITIGEKWTREMQIPLSSEPGAEGSVRATFRLDSLSRNGDVAFISLRGTIARINTPGSPPAGPGYGTSGQLSGTIQIDRRLGWITDSKSTIIVRSTIVSAQGSDGEPERAPIHVLTKITQWIRAMRAR